MFFCLKLIYWVLFNIFNFSFSYLSICSLPHTFVISSPFMTRPGKSFPLLSAQQQCSLLDSTIKRNLSPSDSFVLERVLKWVHFAIDNCMIVSYMTIETTRVREILKGECIVEKRRRKRDFQNTSMKHLELAHIRPSHYYSFSASCMSRNIRPSSILMDHWS